jgi:hypothetical protein
MAKFFNNAPLITGHWNTAIATFNIVDTMGTIVLEGTPAGAITLVLPSHPTDGDWYEFSDPRGVVGVATPIEIRASDGRYVQNEASISAGPVGGKVGGKVVYDASIPSPAPGVLGGMWCLITSNPCPFIS